MRPDPEKWSSIMSKHTIQTCITLAEALPQDGPEWRAVRELITELRHIAAGNSVTIPTTSRPLNLPA
jgi:hypothetical protein